MHDNDEQGVLIALAAYFDALHQLFSGKLGPMRKVWLVSPEVTNLGAYGGQQTGYDSVQAQYARESEFGFAGIVRPEAVYAQVSGDFGYTVCQEVAEEFAVQNKPVPIRRRATHLFRRVAGEWKLVHHHADSAPLQGTRA
jgi:ketosteroid isomerase-like protein